MNLLRKRLIVGLCFLVHAISWSALVDEHGQPHAALDTIFTVLNLPHENTLSSYANIAKERLTRGDRARHLTPDNYAHHQTEFVDLFRQLDMTDAIYPTDRNYDYAVVYGATINTMRERVNFLAQCWRQGIQFKQIVFLTSKRPLFPDTELKDLETKTDHDRHTIPFRDGWVWIDGTALPKTEREAAEMVWNQIVGDDTLRNMPVHYVEADDVYDETLKKYRPANTEDTVIAWQKDKKFQNKIVGKILAISTNPYIGRQDAVMWLCFRKAQPTTTSMMIETVGPAASCNVKTALYLDNLAWWLDKEEQLAALKRTQSQ